MSTEQTYQQCTRCVMDTTSSQISFDAQGHCNYCNAYFEKAEQTFFRPYDVRKKELDQRIQYIKQRAKGQKYDCIVGVSGGMDSSYLLVKSKEYGLNPLVVHFDNGWNSELAVQNINNLVTKLGLELHTEVMDWELFKDLQLAYFRASVIDIEVCTDQLIFSHLYKVAKKYKIKTILSGANVWTETILPRDWRCVKKHDWTNLKNIHKKYGKKPIAHLPRLNLSYKRALERQGFKTLTVFDLEDFNVEQVKQRLTKEFDYVVYPYKHYESVFTRFYQGSLLIEKFGIDKRKAHLSCLICAGQLTRDKALKELKKPAYPTKQQEQEDYEYLLKKWGITDAEYKQNMQLPRVYHDAFGWDDQLLKNRIAKRLELIYKYKIAKLFGVKYTL